MNRRTFLKSIAAACGAAVVCPGELLKSPVEFRPNPAQTMWMRGKGGSYIVGEETRWPKYHNSYILNDKPMPFLVKEFETAFWNTKFKSPLMKRINETNET